MSGRTAGLCVVSARCFPVRFAFSIDVAHSLATRTYTDNVIVELVDEDGRHGYGESVPRSYVTAETVAGAIASLERLLADVRGRSWEDPADVVRYLDDVRTGEAGARIPAAVCALELALLDLAGKRWDMTAAAVAGLDTQRDALTYSLVVPLLPDEGLAVFLGHAAPVTSGAVKIKVDAIDPARRVRMVRDLLGPSRELRVDANCSWTRETAPAFFAAMADCGVVSVEQPLPAVDLAGMAALRGRFPVAIVLDESSANTADVERAAAAGACDMINVRISKCGGLLGAVEMVLVSRMNGLGVQLGAHVGESCLLTSAGAQLAQAVPAFRWLEGCFGTHLLDADLCHADMKFGANGVWTPLDGPGLGVSVDPALLDAARERHIAVADLAASPD